MGDGGRSHRRNYGSPEVHPEILAILAETLSVETVAERGGTAR